MTAPLLQTALHDWHAAQGGRMVDFAGWQMPVQYSSIVTEHQAVREAAGLFDIAHMGRLRFTGPDAARFLDHLVTNDIRQLDPGRICYALVVNEQGFVLDDVLVYHREEDYLLVVNASNRLKILHWIERQKSGYQFEMEDQTTTQFMLALQGPRAEKILRQFTRCSLPEMVYYSGQTATVFDQPGYISRTGYTGEDGFEVILPVAAAPAAWQQLLAAGAGAGLIPAGLGCRDTLRLEAAMPLYGHELSEEIDPLTAGLGFAVKLNKPGFLGQPALQQIKSAGLKQRRVGLELAGKRIPREGCAVYVEGQLAGKVTSGTFSPTLQKSIAMAYLDRNLKTPANLEIDIRGKREAARLTPLPFYQRAARK